MIDIKERVRVDGSGAKRVQLVFPRPFQVEVAGK